MSATAIIKLTGEVIEQPDGTLPEIVESLRLVNEYIKGYEAVKAKLQAKAQELVDESGRFEHDGYMLRVFTTQRMTYDKAVLRQYLDEDTLDLFLEPKKKAVDDYLKENLEQLGDASTAIRAGMVPTGKPYTTVKIERLER